MKADFAILFLIGTIGQITAQEGRTFGLIPANVWLSSNNPFLILASRFPQLSQLISGQQPNLPSQYPVIVPNDGPVQTGSPPAAFYENYAAPARNQLFSRSSNMLNLPNEILNSIVDAQKPFDATADLEEGKRPANENQIPEGILIANPKETVFSASPSTGSHKTNGDNA